MKNEPQAPLSAEITAPDNVEDETRDSWGVMDTETGWYAFTDTDRAPAERRLRAMVRDDPDRPLVLVTRTWRTRTETWYGPTEAVPWHTPCEFVGSADAPDEPAWCLPHKHTEREPVPAEYVRGATADA